jgi:hypothetical protein
LGSLLEALGLTFTQKDDYHDFCMSKSAFATPVERFLVQNQHVRCLCIGFLSKMQQTHAKISMFDACASDFDPKSACSTPVHRILVQNA